MMKHLVIGCICLVTFAVYFTVACGPSTGGGDKPHLPPGGDATYVVPEPDDDIKHKIDQRSIKPSLAKFQQHPSPGYIFSVMDDNSDGNIDACEWMEAGMTTNVREYVKLLDRVDKNGDNVLSPEEFSDIHVRWRYGEGIDADDKQN
ncbi:uncharacterized protein [Apostichopus japonicus]|uniref:uncharacterized protein isoform X5 n=1 Tax=Stichopus japonicus TaxID=307972 RepID=UPI003AB440A8